MESASEETGSTRVASMAMANMRSPFLATERGIAAAITKAFRQGERKRSCARTMVVTSNIELDRMLLHSRATSTVNPEMCSSMPRCSTGTPAAMKSNRAARRRALLQQAHDRIQDEVGKRNHPEQEAKRKERAPGSASAKAKNKSGDPPQYK